MSGDLSTYGGLKTALSEYTGRSGNTTWLANRPIFVQRAHSTLMRDLDIPHLHDTTDLTINAERIAIPSGYRASKRLFLDLDWDKQVKPTSQELRVREAVTYSAGEPRVFAREGAYLAFGPVPDTTYTGKLLFRKALTFFASDEATNAILTDYPMAYLYGALAEAARFDKYEEDELKYEALFRAEIDAINMEHAAAMYEGGTLAPVASGGVA